MTCECYKIHSVQKTPLGGVYVIHNVKNNHCYVGSTTDFRKRFDLHRHLLRNGKHHSPHLQAAWNKYGEQSFVFFRLAFIDTKQQRLTVEQSLLDTLSPEYNVSRLAMSCEGCIRSPETRAKLRLALQDPHRLSHIRELGRRPKSAEQRSLMAEAQLGRHHSDEARAKMRASSAIRWAKAEEHLKARKKKPRLPKTAVTKENLNH
jgi:group I intron endonuclease